MCLMSFTFDPYKLRSGDVTEAEETLMTNPTALSELERYWVSLPRTRGVPLRSDVDPAAMSGLLEDTFILERVAPGVARMRVAGRNITKLIGIEPRGLPLTAAFLPASRPAMAQHIEAAFMTPAVVELELVAPRAVGQPKLHGKIIMLPLRDDSGQINRMLGMIVMSGRRGLGGRRFDIVSDSPVRHVPIVSLRVVPAQLASVPNTGHSPKDTPLGGAAHIGLHQSASPVPGGFPALRLVVSNP